MALFFNCSLYLMILTLNFKKRNCLNFVNDLKLLGDTQFKSRWGKVFFLEIHLKDILEGAMGAMSVIITQCVLGKRRNEHRSIP